MVVDLDAPTLPGISTRIRLRSRYIAPRDSVIPIAIYFGDPPVLLDGCTVEDLNFGFGASADAGVVTNIDAGAGTLRLYDPQRRIDPTNPDPPLATIGTRIRIDIAGARAFTGRIDDVEHDLVTAQLGLVDDLVALAAVEFSETSVPAEVASARVSRILDLAAWPADRRDVGPGGVSLQAGTVSQDAWSELVAVTRNELGALWMAPDGRITWRNRAAAWAGGTPQMVFGCPPSDAPLIDLDLRADQSNLRNLLSTARRTGTARVVSDPTSIAIYGRNSYVQNDLELSSDGDRDLWQDFYLTRQAYPARGVGGFTFRPGATTIAKLLAMPLDTIFRIIDSGHGPDIDRPARYLGARWTISPGLIEVTVVTGEDASIRLVDRSRVIDTAAEWQAVTPFGTIVNIAYREPGLQVATIPAKP